MVWWPFLLQLTSIQLQHTPEGPNDSETRHRQIQCNTNTHSHTYFPTAICLWNNLPADVCQLPAQLQSSTQLSPDDVNACRPCFCLLHCTVFSLFIVITLCYHLHHCFRFTHLDPLIAVRYYSTRVATYLEEEDLNPTATCRKLTLSTHGASLWQTHGLLAITEHIERDKQS